MACGASLCLIKLLQHCFTVQNTELDQSFVALASLIKLLQYTTGTLVQMAPGTVVQWHRWHIGTLVQMAQWNIGTVALLIKFLHLPPSASCPQQLAWTN